MLSSQIRGSFLKFFENNGHKVVESSSVVPQNDPSLLFTNSGMVQFKNVFTGLETREYKRATTAQKCVRAGGKHNDLEQVGFTARHNTFFEMLGNFSFGDYFKEDAIYFAWTFLTKELKLPREKLSVTVYHTDEEAKNIWKKVAGDVLITPISTNDNFWSMGDAGPCGPSSEIFYDHGDDVPGGLPGTPDENGPRYMEIWNLVFMQFEQIQNGEKIPLAKKSIDTGLGLERVAGVMQGVLDNFQIDLFKCIIDEIKAISKTNYDDIYPSYKVIADHIRSVAVLIADGVLPSNEGSGYVLRRILRRAMRHGNLIGVKEPFLYKLVDSFADSMDGAYPELEKSRATIKSTIHMEEQKFLSALERGLKILQNDVKGIPAGGVLSGDKAFKLYDTYGFPLDLTQDILKTENIDVDIAGFETALQEQKNRAKWVGSGETKEAPIWYELKQKLGATEFVGYEKEKCESEILAVGKFENEKYEIIDEITPAWIDEKTEPVKYGAVSYRGGKPLPQYFIIVKTTPFYAESGGQCGDFGAIKLKEKGDVYFSVFHTIRVCDGLIVHLGSPVADDYFKSGDKVILQVDSRIRQKTSANHTATHLLQAALRQVLGKHVEQRGSSVGHLGLHFDFSHSSALSDSEISRVEETVNEWILQDLKVVCETISKDEAISAGAMALFGEKYGDTVRTVSIYDEDRQRISFELCGGTHVSSTGKIGLFKIISECSVAAGIRRIEAVTGKTILKLLKEKEKIVDSLAERLKCESSETSITLKINSLLAEKSELKKNILKLMSDKVQKFSKNSATIYSLAVSDCDMDELRSLNEAIKSKKSAGVIVVANKSGDKVSLIVSVAPDLQKKYNAGQLLKIGLASLDGKGGGGAAFAQGGGIGADKIPVAIEAIKNAIE
ncbi:MAG: alanine--tRNA ligase [Holosporaceae bacterium]|jgi:alanyl-tRNA synthetase|nr:alanine--tRNA ligase [Holosporaceae bacterium]